MTEATLEGVKHSSPMNESANCWLLLHSVGKKAKNLAVWICMELSNYLN